MIAPNYFDGCFFFLNFSCNAVCFVQTDAPVGSFGRLGGLHSVAGVICQEPDVLLGAADALKPASGLRRQI